MHVHPCNAITPHSLPQLILAPIAIMAVLLPVAMLFRFNPTKLVLWLYYGYRP